MPCCRPPDATVPPPPGAAATWRPLQVLFEEMAKLMRYAPKLEDFEGRISLADDMKRYGDGKLNRGVEA